MPEWPGLATHSGGWQEWWAGSRAAATRPLGLMRSGWRRLLRFAGFVAGASVVVAILLVASLWSFGIFDRPAGHHAVDLRLLTPSERLDLAEALGETTGNERPSLPPLEAIPPLEVPLHRESGFVQVEVLVDDQGQVVDAEVIRSVPPGMFEAQALEIAKSREYDPGAPGRRTEMVDFTLESGEP